MSTLHWVYHPKQEAKIVDAHEYKSLLENGWFDSPAKFNLSEEPKRRRKSKKDEPVIDVLVTDEIENPVEVVEQPENE